MADLTVPDRIQVPILTKADEVRSLLTSAIQEISWAHSDLQANGTVPLHAGDGPGRTPDSIRSEVAIRAILPYRIHGIAAAAEALLAQLKELAPLVPPLNPANLTEIVT